jgi:multicomponent Na+:H+ antiporter subunit A
LLQSGYLRAYIDIIVLFVLLTAGWHFVRGVDLPGLTNLSPVHPNDLILVVLAITAIAGALLSRSRMAAIASLGVIGFSIALIFILYGAPDLAMTQMVIETLTVILLVLAFYHLPRFSPRSSKPARARDLIVAGLFGLFTGAMTFAAGVGEIAPPISWFFSESSWTSAYGKNVVNVILVDFRALDTLGEITVLTVAALGAMALLKLRPKDQRKGGGA